jgi:hypothetical protein
MSIKPHVAKADQALTKAGGHITLRVGTMWCAIAFACLALISAPAAFATGNLIVIVQWAAGVFLQLVLLPIIIVGQNIQGAKTEARDLETHDAVMAELAEVRAIGAAIHAKIDGRSG